MRPKVLASDKSGKKEKQPCVSLTIQILLKVIYYTFAVGVSAKSAVSVEV
jgi:hypothetical protein